MLGIIPFGRGWVYLTFLSCSMSALVYFLSLCATYWVLQLNSAFHHWSMFYHCFILTIEQLPKLFYSANTGPLRFAVCKKKSLEVLPTIYTSCIQQQQQPQSCFRLSMGVQWDTSLWSEIGDAFHILVRKGSSQYLAWGYLIWTRNLIHTLKIPITLSKAERAQRRL